MRAGASGGRGGCGDSGGGVGGTHKEMTDGRVSSQNHLQSKLAGARRAARARTQGLRAQGCRHNRRGGREHGAARGGGDGRHR
eukprot:1267827-Prymnesium_polylepis.1